MGITMQLFGTPRNMKTFVTANENIHLVVDAVVDKIILRDER
jgi:hypothetical protein